MNIFENNKIVTIRDNLLNDTRKDKQEHRKAIIEIQKKSELFTKIVENEKKKVDTQYNSAIIQMEEKKNNLEKKMKSLEEYLSE